MFYRRSQKFVKSITNKISSFFIKASKTKQKMIQSAIVPADLQMYNTRHQVQNSAVGYKSFGEEETEIFIKVESVDIGSFPASAKADLMVCIGPRKHYMDFAYNMKKYETNVPHIWTFYSKKPQRASFVIALFKKRYFGINSEIGKVELKLNEFQPNTVTTKEFNLVPPNSNGFNQFGARIRVSVHLNENGSSAFSAPTVSA